MARQSFGSTWWGEQWLKALTHIDYDNRLPRGRSYANKGAVRDLVVKDGTIQARVQGSRSSPYRVTIATPPISPQDSARLLDEIAADPSLIARMLNRELDPSLLERARQLGISVFPTRWQDLGMQCSCPDWAVPCKHLAAVIYLLSREIDGNPFLVFSLRGVDLAQALKARDIDIDREVGAALPTLADLLVTETDPTPETGDLAALERIDFSGIPDMSEPLRRILPAQPTFFPSGDFRELVRRLLARVTKTARQSLEGGGAEPAGASLHPDDRPSIVLDGRGAAILSGAAAIDSVEALLKALAEVEPANLPDLQPEVAALFQVRLAALHLLARGAIVP